MCGETEWGQKWRKLYFNSNKKETIKEVCHGKKKERKKERKRSDFLKELNKCSDLWSLVISTQIVSKLTNY